MSENLTEREVALFSTKIQNGQTTPILALFIPGMYDHGTVVSDVFEPNFNKIDNWADIVNKALDELKKPATISELGRIIIGDGLVVDEDGKVSHSTGAGNNHIPTGGASGQYLKYLSNGNAQWADLDVNLDDYYNKAGVDEKFKNFCPFPVNSLYLSLGSENPSTLWLGTTWQKQEGRFLLGSSGSYALGSAGGASTVTLSVANLPSHTHSASQSAHTHTQTTHTHGIQIKASGDQVGSIANDSFRTDTGGTITTMNSAHNYAKTSGGDTTGSATPSISIGSTGSGTAFSIMPPYLVINIWKRLS